MVDAAHLEPDNWRDLQKLSTLQAALRNPGRLRLQRKGEESGQVDLCLHTPICTRVRRDGKKPCRELCRGLRASQSSWRGPSVIVEAPTPDLIRRMTEGVPITTRQVLGTWPRLVNNCRMRAICEIPISALPLVGTNLSRHKINQTQKEHSVGRHASPCKQLFEKRNSPLAWKPVDLPAFQD